MKALIATVLAMALATASGVTLARDHRDRGHHDGWQSKHHKGHKYSRHHRKHHSRHHYYKPGWSYHYKPRWYYRGHDRRHYRHDRWHYGYNNYYPAVLGATLIGASISHSLFHSHNGAVCYENHGSSYSGGYSSGYSGGYSSGYSGNRSAGYSEVVGCHRIETLPDGSERRVEVPLSQCN